jgi:hypothetical protein
VRSGAVKEGKNNKNSSGERGKSTRPVMIALGSLINTHAKVILLKLLPKYCILKVCTLMCTSIIIPAYDGNVKHAVLLMRSQWMRERKRMPAESIKGILTVSCKFKNVPHEQFNTYVCGTSMLLKEICSSEKYSAAQNCITSSSSFIFLSMVT